MEELLHMTEKDIECVPRIFYTSSLDFGFATFGVVLPLRDFYKNVSLPSGICRWPDGEEHSAEAFWEVCVYGTHWSWHCFSSSRLNCQRYVSFCSTPYGGFKFVGFFWGVCVSLDYDTHTSLLSDRSCITTEIQRKTALINVQVDNLERFDIK